MTLYKKRIELNSWEIRGIENYLKETFELTDFNYNDKTIHFDTKRGYFGAYKINSGEYLYITLFVDEGDNINYTLNITNDTFYQVDNSINVIGDELENIF